MNQKTKSKKSGSEKRKRQSRVSIRLTSEEFAEVAKRADAAQLTLASYARAEILDSPPPRQARRPAVETENVARVLAQLGKIGSNLNQIARHMNSGNSIANETLARALTDVSVMRDACMSALNRKP